MTMLNDLLTPALILDKSKLQRNINRMAARAARLGIPLRPHLKTPKSIEVARLLRDAGAHKYCVSTLTEAEYFAKQGFRDLFYCVPFAPAKTQRALALVESGCKLVLMTDSLDGVECCIEAVDALGPGQTETQLAFALEIDVDGYRSGMPPDPERLVQAVNLLEGHTATRFAGLMSYAGASYGDTSEAAAQRAERHRTVLMELVTALREAGSACPMVSLGSTPAVLHATALPGITELRCGIYVFQDLFQAGIGAAAIDDIAISVLTTVISRQPQHNRVVIDAGALALSKDRSTAGKPFDAQFGLVCDAATCEPIGDLAITSVSQELGLLSSLSGAPVAMDLFPVGRQLRVLPNHADMTAAAYEEYHIVDGDTQIVDVWQRTNRWT